MLRTRHKWCARWAWAVFLVVGACQPPPVLAATRTPADTAFKWPIGSRVHATTTVNQWSDSGGGTLVSVRKNGDKGTIVGGPWKRSDGLISWHINWDVAPVNGWSVQIYLALDSAGVPPPPPPSSKLLTAVGVQPLAGSLTVGQALQLYGTLAYSDGTLQLGVAPFVWTSSDTTVATVTTGGVGGGFVRAIGAGRATIAATDSGKVATSVVTVVAASPAPLGVPSTYLPLIGCQLLNGSTCGPVLILDAFGATVGHISATVTVP